MKKLNGTQEWARYAQMTPNEQLNAFKNAVIMHPHLLAVDHALREVLQGTGGALLVFVCGPSGVGKTALKEHVIRMERAPILNFLARPTLNGTFDWKDYLQSSILALEPSWFDIKVALDIADEKESLHTIQTDRPGVKSRPSYRVKEYELRVSLETAIKRRRPAAVIIDDAHYMGKVRSGRQLQNQLDCIKSLAEVTETVYIKYNPNIRRKLVTPTRISCGRIKKAGLFIASVQEELSHVRDSLGVLPTGCTT